MNAEDKRVKRTRRRLHLALVSLAREKGYEQVTVQEIAARAGVSHRTFYRHYRDREALLEDVTCRVLEELRALMVLPAREGDEALPLLGDPAGDRDRAAGFGTATQREPALFSMRTARYKLHHDIETGRSRLFDLENDPGERENIAGVDPELTSELERRLEIHITDTLAAGVLDVESAEIPEDLQERLRALGYLD